MQGLALIAVCLLIGAALARSERLPDNFCAVLNLFAVRVALPALVLKHIHAIEFDATLWLPLLTPWVVFALSAAAAHLAGRIWGLRRDTVGCLTLVCGTGNTSIVGIPLIQAFVGVPAVGYAVVVDQSNFVVMCTLGMIAASIYSDGQQDGRRILRQMLSYRPLQMLVLALLLRPIQFPVWLDQALSSVGGTLTPIALISVGASFHWPRDWGVVRNFLIGAAIKLMMVPALVLLLWSQLTGVRDLAFTTSVLQAAMPPMIIAGLIATEKNLDPPLTQVLIGVGIPLSFLTTAIWLVFLR
ncbi:AEC family transporter [Aquabacterium sp. A7-Y]|uniref:AEC family transporter n=1 Tax=Aquabacterium sp. A7-Y TaxID=1349605 RepID=UPI00223E101E|nr:AEC family transporter [Aquabacterium sp. A7-Y]MCW7538717.1 AEC family transporter [Aquabacterium sp. A7-Y]